MLKMDTYLSAFGDIIGWPYPPKDDNGNYGGGATDDRGKDPAYGIDCSGAFVRAHKKQNASIYHGSNRIIRVHCNSVVDSTTLTKIQEGLPVFKQRTDLSKMNSSYKKGGQYYNAALPNDYYHIGLITSAEPLTVIHATTPKARKDIIYTRQNDKDGKPESDADYLKNALAALNKAGWGKAGKLDDLPYSDTPTPTPAPTPAPTPSDLTGKVCMVIGGGLNLRSEANLDGKKVLLIPDGATVKCYFDNYSWAIVEYVVGHRLYAGYVSSKYLKEVG